MGVMARLGEVSRHAIDDVHGMRAFWADRELRRDREGAVTHHRPERVGDLRVGRDVRLVKSSRSSIDFAKGSVRPKPWQQLDTGDVPPEPLRRHPKVKPHRWGIAGDMRPLVLGSQLSRMGDVLTLEKSRAEFRNFNRDGLGVPYVASMDNSKRKYSCLKMEDHNDFGIPLFSGGNGEEDALGWIQEVDDFFRHVYVSSEKEAKPVARSLRDFASYWWNRL